MPDISLCKNYICPLAEQCYRFTAKPDEYFQAYSEFEPDDDGNCDYFMAIPEWIWYTDENE